MFQNCTQWGRSGSGINPASQSTEDHNTLETRKWAHKFIRKGHEETKHSRFLFYRVQLEASFSIHRSHPLLVLTGVQVFNLEAMTIFYMQSLLSLLAGSWLVCRSSNMSLLVLLCWDTGNTYTTNIQKDWFYYIFSIMLYFFFFSCINNIFILEPKEPRSRIGHMDIIQTLKRKVVTLWTIFKKNPKKPHLFLTSVKVAKKVKEGSLYS